MNAFPLTFPEKPHETQLAKEVYAALGCKEQLTIRFIEVLFVAIQVFDHKQALFGSGNIAKFGETGVLIRVNDKLERLVNLRNSGKEPKDETKNDSWGDILVYGGIALMNRYGLWPGSRPETPTTAQGATMLTDTGKAIQAYYNTIIGKPWRSGGQVAGEKEGK